MSSLMADDGRWTTSPAAILQHVNLWFANNHGMPYLLITVASSFLIAGASLAFMIGHSFEFEPQISRSSDLQILRFPEPTAAHCSTMTAKYTLVEAIEKLSLLRSAATTFSPRAIAGPTLKHVLQLTQMAPTSFNLQPYKMLVVQSEDAKQALSSSMLGANGRKVAEAPVSIVFLSYREPYKLTKALMALEESRGADAGYVASLPAKLSFLVGPGWLSHKIRSLTSHLASPLTPSPVIPYGAQWSTKNSMFAAQQLLLAATAHGLSSAPMEGFDERRICYQLQIPIEQYSVPLVVALGYAEGSQEDSAPSAPLTAKSRYPLESVCYEDRYGQAAQFNS